MLTVRLWETRRKCLGKAGKNIKQEKNMLWWKRLDKDRAKADDSYHSATFDSQAVLTTPFAGDEHIYYKRMFLVYNFTIYDNSSANGTSLLPMG